MEKRHKTTNDTPTEPLPVDIDLKLDNQNKKRMARSQVAESLDKVKIASGKTVHISTALIGTLRNSLVEFLVQHHAAFAWSHSNMEGINPNIIVHQLSILPNVKPIRQKRRTFSPKRNQVVVEKVGKLLATNFIQEVHYPDWLSNVVMVNKWQVADLCGFQGS